MNKDRELQKFYDIDGKEISVDQYLKNAAAEGSVLKNVDREGISTEESVQQMFKKVQGDYSSLAGAPMSMKNMTLNQFKKEYTRNPNFRDAVGNSRYSKGLISAIKTDQGN